ncbi:hypothetical protein Tco_0214792 [Tanacetum coccineum]
MPPRRFKKKSVKRIVGKRVAKLFEEYEKTRLTQTMWWIWISNTGGMLHQRMQWFCLVLGDDIEATTMLPRTGFDVVLSKVLSMKRKRLKKYILYGFPRESRKCYFFKAAYLHDAINMARELILNKGFRLRQKGISVELGFLSGRQFAAKCDIAVGCGNQ